MERQQRLWQRIDRRMAVSPLNLSIWSLGIVLSVGIIYSVLVYTALGPLNGFWSTDQGTKLIQVQSLLLTKYRTNALVYPGEIFDPTHAASPLRGTYVDYNSQSFSIWSPLFAALTSIPFFILGYAGLYCVPIGATILTLVVCGSMGQPFLGRFWTCCALVVAGLASPLFFYSLVFWEHTLVTFLTMLATWLLVRGYTTHNAAFAFLSGCTLGSALWIRNETLLCAFALAMAFVLVTGWRGLRVLYWFGGGGTLCLVGLLAFNQLVYGTWIGPHILVAGQANDAALLNGTSFFSARLAWAAMLLVPSTPRASMWLMLAAISCALVTHVAWSERVKRFSMISTLLMLVCSSIASVVTIGSGVQTNPLLNGGEQTALVLVFPLALLGLLPAPQRPRSSHQQHETNHILTADHVAYLLRWFALCFVALAWLLHIPWGASQWGPRILLPAIPPLILWGFFVLARWSAEATPLLNVRLSVTPIATNGRSNGALLIEPLFGVVMLILVVAGALAQVYGLHQLRQVNSRNHMITTTVAQSEQRVIITDVWYGPPVLAPLFYDSHLLYIVDDAAAFDGLVDRLRTGGITRFYYLGDRFETVTATSRYHAHLITGAEQRFAYHLKGRVIAVNDP